MVPVLVDDGEVHIESNDILKYLDNKFPTVSLIPADKEEEINQMMIEENDLHLDIRNVTFKFLVPKFLNNVKIQEKSNQRLPCMEMRTQKTMQIESFGRIIKKKVSRMRLQPNPYSISNSILMK